MIAQPSLPQLMWHVTDRCPLGCPYCFATKTGLDFNPNQIDQLLNIFSQLGVRKVDIAGGEPLIWRHLPATVGGLMERRIAATITTSGVGSAILREWVLQHS